MSQVNPAFVLTLEGQDPQNELTEAVLQAALARVGTEPSVGFAVLEQSETHFLQTAVNPEGADGTYLLEVRDGDNEHHMQSEPPLTIDEVQLIFRAYAAVPDGAWRKSCGWIPVDFG